MTAIHPSKTKSRPRSLCVIVNDVDDWNGENPLCRLAELFAASGDDVTLLWVPRWDSRPSEAKVGQTRARLQASAVTLEVLLGSDQLFPSLMTADSRSAAVLHHFERSQYDLIYAPLEGGLLYFTLLASETGVLDLPPNVVVAQAPQSWANEVNKRFFEGTDNIAIAHMEKYCAEQTDNLVCSSQVLRKWMLARGWRVKKATVVRLPLPYGGPSSPLAPRHISSESTSEFVILAGPEFCDGLTLLCDAFDRLAIRTPDKDLTITAFGPFGQIMGEHTAGLMLRRAEHWPFRLDIVPEADLESRLALAVQKGATAIIPTLATSTGTYVTACQEAGIPFVATDAGANQEMATTTSRRQMLVSAEAASLATAMNDARKMRSRPRQQPRLNIDRTGWLGTREPQRRKPLKRAPRRASRLVSIVMAHRNRPHYLSQAIRAIEAQSYSPIELILVDDGSDQPAATQYLDRLGPEFAARGWKILRRRHEHLGSSRNAGVKEARGDLILFVDDDNALLPEAVDRFVRGIDASDADICTAFHLVFYEDTIPEDRKHGLIQYLPLGGPDSLGLIHNVYGDANAMVRRSVFDKIGFQIEGPQHAMHDWEFFARASLAGLKIRPIPRPLYWYRSKPDGMFRQSNWRDNRIPIIERFASAKYEVLRPLVELTIAQNAQRSEVESAKENLRYVPSHRKYLPLCDTEPNSPQALDYVSALARADGRPNTAAGSTGQPATLAPAGQTPEMMTGDVLVVSEAVMKSARLLTPRPSALPQLLIAPNNGGIFLRPHRDGVVAAVLDNCFPAFFRKVEVVVEIAHEAAAPLDFAIGLARPDSQIDWGKDVASQLLAFSGWQTVRDRFARHQLNASLPARKKITLSVIILLRFHGFPDSDPTNSFFRSIKFSS